MNQMRHHFFSRSVGTGDEHACLGGRYLIYYLAHVGNRGTLADHLQPVRRYFLTQLLGLLLERFGLQGISGSDENAVEIQGLEQEVIRTDFEGLYRRLYIAVTGDHDNRRINRFFAFFECF